MGIWDDVVGTVKDGTGTNIWMFVALIIAVLVGLLLLVVAGWYWFFKKRWNIKAEIKLTRSGGGFTNAEWGKAYFNAKQGVCYVKRPGVRQSSIPVKIFDIRKYIQGDNTVTFIQVSPEELLPVLNNSWEEYEDDQPMKDSAGNIRLDGEGKPIHEKAALINIRVDTGLNKAWRAAWTQAAKQAYSLKSFFAQFQTPIAIAIVIIAVFVGFAMVWTRLGSICG